MDDFWPRIWVFVVGAATGTVFYGGLWWTVREVPGKPNAGLWFAASSVVRTLVAVGGFWLVSDGNWRTIVVCLVGFLAARLVVTYATRPVPLPIADAKSSGEGNDETQP